MSVVPSFPTRRSSDLVARQARAMAGGRAEIRSGRGEERRRARERPAGRGCADVSLAAVARARRRALHRRSEEHTSELQSHSELVCRLLLEKKNLAKAL